MPFLISISKADYFQGWTKGLRNNRRILIGLFTVYSVLAIGYLVAMFLYVISDKTLYHNRGLSQRERRMRSVFLINLLIWVAIVVDMAHTFFCHLGALVTRRARLHLIISATLTIITASLIAVEQVRMASVRRLVQVSVDRVGIYMLQTGTFILLGLIIAKNTAVIYCRIWGFRGYPAPLHYEPTIPTRLRLKRSMGGCHQDTRNEQTYSLTTMGPLQSYFETQDDLTSPLEPRVAVSDALTDTPENCRTNPA